MLDLRKPNFTKVPWDASTILCPESQGDIHMTPTNITPANAMRITSKVEVRKTYTKIADGKKLVDIIGKSI